jgi:hypothetical protein
MVKHNVLVILALVIGGVMVAGCTQSPPVPVATPTPTMVPTPDATTVATTAEARPSFSLGQAYLDDPGGYSFQSENDVIVKEFRVDNPSWGINVKIQPLNTDLQYCWFTMNVTQMDNGMTDTYGYGRQYSFDLEQKIPMYNTGPYKITMKGNRVKVWVTAAKRNP